MKAFIFVLCGIACSTGHVVAQLPSTFVHLEVSSGLMAGERLKPVPYIPMLREGWLFSLNGENSYLGVHLAEYWANPGFGLSLDASYQWRSTTLAQLLDLFLYPEAGYAIVFSPENGGSPFVGGGAVFATSYLMMTIRGSYQTRVKQIAAQVGLGIRF